MADHATVLKTCEQCGLEKAIQRRFRFCSPNCASAAMRKSSSPNPSSPTLLKETDTITPHERVIHLPLTRIKTEEELIAACQIDLTQWERSRIEFGAWQIGAKHPVTGEILTEQLYSVRATFKPRPNGADISRIFRELVHRASTKAPKFPPIPRKPSKDAHMLELAPMDHHFGQLCWPPETSHASYDLDRAIREWRTALTSLLSRTSSFPLDRILLVLGNDLFHIDDRRNATFAGTGQDTDSRYYKIFKRVQELSIQTITQLREIAPVQVVMVRGNHDYMSVYHLGSVLSAWFHNAKDVLIDNEPPIRKYIRYGNSLLMFTHGHTGKANEFPLLMARERREEFGATRFHEIHCGHFHEERVKEFRGIKVRVLPSLAPPNSWASESGLVNQPTSQALVWHKQEGLVSLAQYASPEYVLDPVPDLARS